MKKRLAVALLALACSPNPTEPSGNGDGGPPSITPLSVTGTSVVISPHTATIAPNGTQQFTILITYSNGTTSTSATAVHWTIPSGMFISNGLVTAGSATGTFKVIVTQIDGPADTATLIVATGPAAPTLTLTSSKTKLVLGDSSTLTWTSANDTLCTSSGGWTGTRAVSGSLVVKPTATTTYTLTCAGAGGSIAKSVTDTVTPPAPTLTFTSSKTTLVLGDSSTLTWTSANDTLCTSSGGWTGTRAVSGSLVVKPTATTTYTLTCAGLGGNIAKSVTDTVTTPPPPTLTFTSSKTAFVAGDSSTLTWTSTNDTLCTSSGGWTGTRAVSGSLVVKPTATTTYTLTCAGAGGSIAKSVTDTVTPPAPTLTFTSSKTTLVLGDSSTLTWTSANDTLCTSSGGWTGSRAVSGSLVVKPTVTTTYTLTCAGLGGNIAKSVTDTVTTPPPPTLTFTSSKTAFVAGDSSTLTWTSTNDTLCTSSGGWTGTRAVSGSLVVKPTATTTYTLTCAGAGGSIAKSVTDTVTPPAPTLTFTSSKTTLVLGDSSTLTWTSANDTLCTSSGGWTGSRAVSGSLVVKPTVTTTYTLTCAGLGGNIAKSVTDTVTAPAAPTLTFTSSKTTLVLGDSSTLTWTSANDTLCTSSGGWTGTRAVSGSLVVKPTATTTYTLTCAGLGGNIAKSVTDTVTPPPPTLTFTSSKTAIVAGDSSTLTWTSANDTLCTSSGGWTGTRALSGSLVVKPTATTTYTLTCAGLGGNIAKSVTDTVTSPPPTLAFASSKTAFVAGDSSTLTWTSANDTLCTASGGWTGTQSLSGSLVVKPTTTTTYTLTCGGAGGSIGKSVTDTVTAAPPPTLTLTSSKTTFLLGDSSTLTWTSANDTLCTASGGWTGTRAVSGSLVVKPTATTTYTLTCGGLGGNIAKSVTDTVTVPPPPTLAFTSSKTTILVGDSSTLTWTSTNDTLCTASGGWTGTQPLNGSLVVRPATTMTYTLSCGGPGGSIAKSVTDTVTTSLPPTLTFASSKTTFLLGDSSTLTWTSANDTLCTSSGGWTGTRTLSGSLVVKPTATTTYTLTCGGPGGSIAKSVTDTVTLPPPPTLAFASSKTALVLGDSSTLTWTSANDTLCTASGGWTGNQQLNGSLVVKPTTTTTYTLTCGGAGGSIGKSVTDTVTAAPPPPPTLAFTSSKTTFLLGDSSTLTWTSTNDTLCTSSGGWTGTRTLSGSLVVKPTATTTYTLTCGGPGGSIAKSVTDTVTLPPPPTLAFASSKTALVLGDSSTLTWTSANDTLCTASGGWTGNQQLNGSLVVKPTTTTTYTLTCGGAGGSIGKSVTDTVTAAPPPPPTLAFTSSKTTFLLGDSSTLTWTSTNDTLCTSSGGWTGTRAVSGSLVVKPTATTTYTLTCAGLGGNIAKSVTDTVTLPPPPTLTFTSSKTTFLLGDSSTLTWTSANDTLCTSSGGWTGARTLSGSLVVKPTATTTYTLTCGGSGGSIAKSVTDTVTVPPPPALTLASSKTMFLQGDSSTLTWTSANDTLCTASGGWTGTQPLNGSLVVKPTTPTTYTLTCGGAGGSIGKSVTDTVTTPPPPPPPPPPNGSYTYPLKGSNHSLVDQTGQPFLFMGDAAWSLIAQLTDQDAETYFATRQSQGFTVAMINVLEHKFSTNAPANIYGQKPFTGANFTTPNDAYFQHMDAVVQSAANHGIVVMLDALYLGASCSNEGWAAEVSAASASALQAWGVYLGTRYRNAPNIIWQIGGDVDPSRCGAVAKLTALVNGILSVDPNHPFITHNNAEETVASAWGNVSWITINGVYTYSSTLYSLVTSAVSASPVRPVILLETKYENETEWNVTQQQLRSQIYWTLFSGGIGNVFGDCPVWNFDTPQHQAYCPQTGWKTYITSQGAANMQMAAKLLNARHWSLLVPDASHTVLTAGYGSGTTLATTAQASDGSSIIAYLPTSRAVTVNTSSLAGPTVAVRWYNPATGVWTTVGDFAKGSISVTPPVAGDWVLVVDSDQFGLSTP